MAAGRHLPSEVATFQDPTTGRTVRQLTAGAGHEYPLYYQAFSMTRDGRWLAFYSERDGTTQLYRLDRRDGTITQLTAGRTDKTGWWPWTSMAFRGVYAYIGCLDLASNDVYYHDRDEIRAINLDTLADRLLVTGPEGMRPFSQMSCSFDGRFVATVWVDQEEADRVAASHEEAQAQRLPIQQARLYWRDVMHCRLDVIDTSTCEVTTLLDLRAPFHNMVIAADNRHLLVVTPPGTPGSLLVADRERPGEWHRLAPPAGIGRFCHFHAGENGRISFDSNIQRPDGGLVETFIGQIDADGSDPQAWSLGYSGYCHVGHDLAGEVRFASVDNGNDVCGHHLAMVEPRPDGKADLHRITTNLPSGNDQRWHAHPLLTPDHRSIVYTAMGDDGFCHIYEVDVSDLTGGFGA